MGGWPMTSVRPPTPLPDYSARPLFRLPGAFMCGALAVLFLSEAGPLFQHAGPALSRCGGSWRDRWTCEVGNWMLGALPVPWQGPVLGLPQSSPPLSSFWQAGGCCGR